MNHIEEGRRVLGLESKAIAILAEQLDECFTRAVDLVLATKGRLILTGMGKSGQIAQKIASTLSSTGTPSMYLHPAESSHGDLGMIERGDVIVALSHSGESNELNTILKFAARRGNAVIAITAGSDSTLGRAAEVCLLTHVTEEACPMRLAPTTSSTVSLALGDALAMAVLKARGFKEEDYAEYHPGGKLGRKLLTMVKDVMHTGEAVPLVQMDRSMSDVLSLMTAKEVRGVAGVVDAKGELAGIVTDGDIRRRLEKGLDFLSEPVSAVMSKNPKTIDLNEQAEKALFVMEQFRIQMLFAVDKHSETPTHPVGLIHLQDLLQANIR